MMQTDFFTDTLIQLMREVFAPQAISSEQRARIYARIASNQSVETVERTILWGFPAIPYDQPVADDTPDTDETDQLWLFPDFEAWADSDADGTDRLSLFLDFEAQANSVESTLFSLLS